MNSPFDRSAFDRASSPMFDEVVSITGSRAGHARAQTLRVAVFDDATGEPIDENALDSETETIRCLAREHDWRFIRDCMVRGDAVRRPNGSEYAVTKVVHDNAMGWLFAARRTK